MCVQMGRHNTFENEQEYVYTMVNDDYPYDYEVYSFVERVYWHDEKADDKEKCEDIVFYEKFME
jgi:hypothetical protein